MEAPIQQVPRSIIYVGQVWRLITLMQIQFF